MRQRDRALAAAAGPPPPANNPEELCAWNARWNAAWESMSREEQRGRNADWYAAQARAKGHRRSGLEDGTPPGARLTAEQAARAMAEPCIYCGAPAEHLDHIVPLARGGAHTAGNTVAACAPCNQRKHTARGTEFGGAPNALLGVEERGGVVRVLIRDMAGESLSGLFAPQGGGLGW